MKMFTLLIMLGIAIAQVACAGLLPVETAPGPCPRPTTVTNFQPERFQGLWYDIKRFKNTITQGSCGSAVYTWYPNNNSFTAPYQSLEYPTNTIQLIGTDIPNGKFRTLLNGVPTPSDSWILDADYEHYQVTYTCIEVIPLLLNSQTVNIYSRSTTLDAQYLNAVLANLINNKLDVTRLMDVEQDDTVCGRN